MLGGSGAGGSGGAVAPNAAWRANASACSASRRCCRAASWRRFERAAAAPSRPAAPKPTRGLGASVLRTSGDAKSSRAGGAGVLGAAGPAAAGSGAAGAAVSYTHLTLPTIYSV